MVGIVFVTQSKSIGGPQSSFMYGIPQWSVSRFGISMVGLVVLACGIIIRLNVS